MRIFTKNEIEKWINYTDENVLEKEEFLGRCYVCGRFLKNTELPIGPERKVVCSNDREFFEIEYKELEESGDLK
ncbi:hypothetical protein ERX35_001025 [Macrococcus equipercicus]|uniref:DUF1642 domain-containing protein n=1 Tax=Macrococcus equipercicus TaxID=69967 RepID=A0ABQ6RBB7_9STAP|nr:hypothetical protein [Macrococcus equipercicus]KAA1042495.1 hypothetical protein ERX35_001025 [Macrococcus equipercicus]